MIERQQNLRHATKQKLAANFTLSGVEIRNGINIMGSPTLCECGFETVPGSKCPKCSGY
jgi:predicted Zn-ribbon and HTH transcriptional regulator